MIKKVRVFKEGGREGGGEGGREGGREGGKEGGREGLRLDHLNCFPFILVQAYVMHSFTRSQSPTHTDIFVNAFLHDL